MIRHQDFLDLGQSPDWTGFEQRLISFAHALEFELVVGTLVIERPRQDSIVVYKGNTPSAYLESFMDVDASRRDPVLARMRRLSTPIVYDQSLYVQSHAGDLWEEQARFGYKTGIAVALHLPGSKHFYFGIDRTKPLPRSDVRRARLMADVQLLAVHAQDAADRLFQADAASTDDAPKLTPKEREVLQWTMAVKSALAVGAILGISENTVNFHLKNVMSKLGVSSKHQAVLRAISFGLV